MRDIAHLRRWWRRAGIFERVAAVVSAAAVAGLVALVAVGGGGRSVGQAAIPSSPQLAGSIGLRYQSVGRVRAAARRVGAGPGRGSSTRSGSGSPVSASSAGSEGASSTPVGILGVLEGVTSSPGKSDLGQGWHGRSTATAAGRGPVAVEFDYQDGGAADSFFAQYGVQAEAGDPAAQARATADWINQHGGLDGHRLVLRMRHFDFYRDQLSVLDQATCADAATAPTVLADVDSHASTDVLIPCLSKHGIPTVVDTSTDPAAADFARWPDLLFSPGSAAVDRPQAAFVAALQGAGFFQGARVGILEAEGLPQFDSATGALKRTLAAAGVRPVADAVVSTEDPASFFSSEANAELKLRLARVQRVVVFDYNGIIAGQFMRLASVQGYHPQFGLTSMASPQFLAAQAPSSEMHGAVAVGWSPLVDVPAADDPTTANVVRGVCDQAFAAEHVATGGRTPFGQYTAYQTCSDLLVIQAAVTASGSVTPPGLAAGIRQIGSVFTSPLVLSSAFGARNDGAAALRVARYQDSCSCFQYTGPLSSF